MDWHRLDVTKTTYININQEILWTEITRFSVEQPTRILLYFFFLNISANSNSPTGKHTTPLQSSVKRAARSRGRSMTSMKKRNMCNLQSRGVQPFSLPRVLFPPFLESGSRRDSGEAAAPRSSALSQTFQLQTIRGSPTDVSGKARVHTTRAPCLTAVMRDLLT